MAWSQYTASNPHYERQRVFDGAGVLCIYRKPLPPKASGARQPGSRSTYVPTALEPFVAILSEGRILAFNGHVDLGTGVRTAFGQIVADELDVSVSQVEMVMGNTDDAPNQGPTIASASIQVSAVPLRAAAAQARLVLLKKAAQDWDVPISRLSFEDGMVKDESTGHQVSIFSLVKDQQLLVELDTATVTKEASQLKHVGKEVPRVDIPAKVMGEAIYVHDVRVLGMLHGRVVRPPYAGRDTDPLIGKSLVGVNKASVADIKGLVDVVVIGDFVGVVAEREEQAILAAEKLECEWRPLPRLADLEHDVEGSLRALPSIYRELERHGEPDETLGAVKERLSRTYLWPYQLHGSIGPSCSVADWQEESGEVNLTIWSGSQNPHSLRADIALLVGLEENHISIIRHEASGCYGRNCADDVCADAALLSRAVKAPVRVQLSRRDEHGWEPKGAAQIIDVKGGELASGELVYDLLSRYPSNDSATLALLLTGKLEAVPNILEMGDRTAVPPYRITHMRAACDDVAPVVRASWLRGVSALPNVFAHESFIDELAYQAQADPIEYRLRYLKGERPCALLRDVRAFSDWDDQCSYSSHQKPDDEGWVHGRGVAYAHYIHGKFPGIGAAMAAVVIRLKVNLHSGEIRIKSVHLVQDAGQIINPAGIRHQVHGNIVQTLSRTLWERAHFGAFGCESLEWGGYPILDFTELPDIKVRLLEPEGAPPLGVGESASLPIAPAIANALFDATGHCFRRPPFTPETIKIELDSHVSRRLKAEASLKNEAMFK